jgi:hypothetical protein
MSMAVEDLNFVAGITVHLPSGSRQSPMSSTCVPVWCLARATSAAVHTFGTVFALPEPTGA